MVHSNITTVFVDWSGSFSLNGPLREYSLTENNLRIYSGFHSSLHIPRTSDKSMPIWLYFDLCLCLIVKLTGSLSLGPSLVISATSLYSLCISSYLHH